MKISTLFFLSLCASSACSAVTCRADLDDISSIMRILSEIRHRKRISFEIKSKALSGSCRSPVTKVLILLKSLARKFNMMANNLTSEIETKTIATSYNEEFSKFRAEFEKLRQNAKGKFEKALSCINEQITSLEASKQILEIKLSATAERLQNVRKELCVLKLQNNELTYAVDTFNKMLPKDLPQILTEVINKSVDYELVIQFASRIVDFDVRAKALIWLYQSMGEDKAEASVILLESSFWQLTVEITEDNDFLHDMQKQVVNGILDKLSPKTMQLYSKWKQVICTNKSEEITYLMNYMTVKQLEMLANQFIIGYNVWVLQNCLLDKLHILNKCTTVGAYEVLLNASRTVQKMYLAPIVYKMTILKERCKLEVNEGNGNRINKYLHQIKSPKFTNSNINDITKCHKHFSLFDSEEKTCIRISQERKIIKFGSFNVIDTTPGKGQCSIFSLELQEFNGTRFKIIERATAEPLTRLNYPSHWSTDWNIIGSAYRSKPGLKLNTDDGWFLEANHVNDTVYITNDFDIPVADRVVSYLARVQHRDKVHPLFFRWDRKYFFKMIDHVNALWKIKCVR
uniref:Uncharacterized protein n=2 Tax=Culex quinquefasciatus TaxID=7176 RepID=A0A1S4J7P8_CULQU